MKMQRHIVCALAVVMCCLQLYGVYGQSCSSACSGGQICVYGTCTTITNCECVANPKSLVKCVFPKNTGDDEGSCVASGCCWNTKKSRCHTKNTAAAATSCTNKVDHALRVDAGWGRITPNDCMCVGGCFDSSVKNTFWCFVPDEPPTEVDLREDCSGANVVCADPNASCQNGVCTCKAGFTNSNGVCAAEKDVGEPCSGTDVCVDPHASCTGGVCACDAGYRAHSGVCAKEVDVDEACGATAVCKDQHASCTGGVCACNAGYHNKNGVCTPPVDVDDPCDAADVCKDPNAVCTNGKCQCTVMFNFRDGECKEICKKRIMDIVFIIDNSGSIDATEMAGQKLFLEKLTESFTIDDADTRVGLVRFGTGSRVLNPLNNRNTPGDVGGDLSALAIANEWTNTPAGLNEMTNMFNTQGGSHQKLGVLLTDGESNRGILSPAIAAIPGDVTMFSVGVDGYEMSELESIAGDADRVYATDEFDALIQLIPKIRKDMCPP